MNWRRGIEGEEEGGVENLISTGQSRLLEIGGEGGGGGGD